jgi:hypothetical protein
MPVPPCVYRDLSDDAVRIEASGKETRIDVWLCNWMPEKPVPPYIRRFLGMAIEPERDCASCPVRRDR